MEDKIKFALIGCSRISKKHLEALDELSNKCVLTDVCDLNKDAADTIAAKHNVNSYYTVQDLHVNSKADCIIIATPSGLHPSQSIQSLENDFHVVTEKPMATLYSDAIDMVKVAEKKSKFLFVVKQVRFLEQIVRIKKAIDSERFGKIFLINVNLFITRPDSYFSESEWRGSKILDGGALLNQSSHFIDLLLWFLGSPEQVSAFNETLARDIETEDVSVVNVRFKNGALASINTTILTYPENLENSVTIIGEKGTVKLGGKFINKVEKWSFLDDQAYDLKEGDILDFPISHTPFYENVINTIKGYEKPAVSGKEGIKSMQLIEDCYESSRKKIIIDYSEN